MSADQLEIIPVLTDAIPVAAPLEDEGAAAPLVDAARAAEPPAEQAAVPAAASPDVENLIAELQTRLAAGTFTLTEELMREAFNEMEAKLQQQISARLRSALPDLIDTLLREHLAADRD